MKILLLALAAMLFSGPIQAADKPVKPTPKHFVAMITAPFYCPPCERMKPVVKQLQKEGFPITILTDRDQIAKLGVSSYPTFIGIVNGKPGKRIVGACSKADLKSLLPKKLHPPVLEFITPEPISELEPSAPITKPKPAPRTRWLERWRNRRS